MSPLVKTLVTLTAALGTLAGAATTCLVLDHHASDRLDAEVSVLATALVPGGTVDRTDVTDSPALVAEHRDHVQQAVVHAHTAQGRPVLLIVRELDKDAATAESVSWQISEPRVAPGWHSLRDDTGSLDRARRVVDGRRWEVRATASVEEDDIAINFTDLTVDGEPATITAAPPAVKDSLHPATVRLPVPEAAATARSVWFDDHGVGVDVFARDVSAAPDNAPVGEDVPLAS